MESASVDLNVRIINFELLFGKDTWMVCNEGDFVEIALKGPFVDLGIPN